MCSIHLLISTIQSYVAVVGRVITDDEDGTQQFPEELQFTTHIERLDSILNLVGMNIGLMKMDAQGFECKILQGMGQYIPMDIKFIKTEFSTRFLKGQGCLNLVQLLHAIAWLNASHT